MVRHNSNTIIKFVNDTTVIYVCPITDNNETAYREEVRDLIMWCKDYNLPLNVIKTKEMIVDYRKRRFEHAPILMEQVKSLKFLGVHITKHTKTVVKRAQKTYSPSGD